MTTILQIPSRRSPDLDTRTRRAEKMRALMDLAARAAPLDDTVLITGESSVGKEAWPASCTKRRRGRRSATWRSMAARLRTRTSTTELFGHVRSALTGAIKDHACVFEAAHRGTVFRDEIGDVTPAMRVKLLRVITGSAERSS